MSSGGYVKISECRVWLQEGMHIRILNSDGSASLEGVVGEIDFSHPGSHIARFYLWHNDERFDGARGSKNPKDYGWQYSWVKYFTNSFDDIELLPLCDTIEIGDAVVVTNQGLLYTTFHSMAVTLGAKKWRYGDNSLVNGDACKVINKSINTNNTNEIIVLVEKDNGKYTREYLIEYRGLQLLQKGKNTVEKVMINAKILLEKNACTDGFKRFVERFGKDDVEINELAAQLQRSNLPLYLKWLKEQFPDSFKQEKTFKVGDRFKYGDTDSTFRLARYHSRDKVALFDETGIGYLSDNNIIEVNDSEAITGSEMEEILPKYSSRLKLI
jgi:hypothetical protein